MDKDHQDFFAPLPKSVSTTKDSTVEITLIRLIRKIGEIFNCDVRVHVLIVEIDLTSFDMLTQIDPELIHTPGKQNQEWKRIVIYSKDKKVRNEKVEVTLERCKNNSLCIYRGFTNQQIAVIIEEQYNSENKEEIRRRIEYLNQTIDKESHEIKQALIRIDTAREELNYLVKKL